jgi:hypothetical protein
MGTILWFDKRKKFLCPIAQYIGWLLLTIMDHINQNRKDLGEGCWKEYGFF